MAVKRIEDIIIKALGDGIQEGGEPGPNITQTGISVEVDSEESSTRGTINGTLAVINGKVVVRQPRGNGKYPTIKPGQGVEILIDGRKIQDETLLTEDNRLEVYTIDIEPESFFDIAISDDEMEVYLTVNVSSSKRYRLRDHEETERLVLNAEMTEEIPPRPISIDEVTNRINELGITCSVDYNVIKKELAKPSGHRVIIARGQSPIPPRDGYIEYFFDMRERTFKELAQNERRDYLDQGKFQSVEIGTVLAIKHSPVPGVPGTTVRGKVIPVREPEEIELCVGEGVTLVAGGQKAVAVMNGRPVVSGKKKRIKIMPELVIPGDVDITTGHIEFKGDVVVRGNVREGLTVRATGRVEILGNVYSGNIFAGDDTVIYGNLIGGKVTAGGEGAFFSRILPVVNQLSGAINKLYASLGQLKNNPSFTTQDLNIKGDGNLIKFTA